MRQLQCSFLLMIFMFAGCAGMQLSGDPLIDAEVTYQETLKKLTQLGNQGKLSSLQITRLNKQITMASKTLKLAKSLDSTVAKDNSLLFLQTVLVLQAILTEVENE